MIATNTLPKLEAAMALLRERIAHEPGTVITSTDRELFKLLREIRPVISAMISEHNDGECYCPENLAIKETCPHCTAKLLLETA